MHCHICDVDSNSVSLTEPCGTCQEAIYECLAGYPKLGDEEDKAFGPELDVGC